MAFKVGPTNDEAVNEVVNEILDGSEQYIILFTIKRPYTFCRVNFIPDGKDGFPMYKKAIRIGVGFTKVDFPDRWVPEEGLKLALQRAVKDLLYGTTHYGDEVFGRSCIVGTEKEPRC